MAMPAQPAPRMLVQRLLPPVLLLLLLLLLWPSPSLALVKGGGSCVVNLTVTTGMFVGLSNTTSLSLRRQFNDIAGKARATKIFVRPRSLTDANRGAITGRLPLIFPAGTRCAFSNSQVDEGDAGHAVLVAALKGLRVGGVGAQHSAFSVSIANFSGSYNTTGQYASNATFNINNTTLDLAMSTDVAPNSKTPVIVQPSATILRGTATLRASYSQRVRGVKVEGRFPNITAAALPAVPVNASSCSLSLKRVYGAATFTLVCQGFKLRLADINSGGAVAALTLRQGGVKNASVKATGLLTSAYLF